MAEGISELVNSSRLVTEFYLPNFVVHHLETVNEIWDLREEIGYGGSGVVRKEERRVHSSGEKYQGPMVRAVKQMRKVPQNPDQGQWNYRAELEAVVKFSQPEVCKHVWWKCPMKVNIQQLASMTLSLCAPLGGSKTKNLCFWPWNIFHRVT